MLGDPGNFGGSVPTKTIAAFKKLLIQNSVLVVDFDEYDDNLSSSFQECHLLFLHQFVLLSLLKKKLTHQLEKQKVDLKI